MYQIDIYLPITTLLECRTGKQMDVLAIEATWSVHTGRVKVKAYIVSDIKESVGVEGLVNIYLLESQWHKLHPITLSCS